MNPDTFYLMKGFIALGGTMAIVIHMNMSWSEFDRDHTTGVRTGVSQRMRYISWFLFVVLIAGASKEQITEAAKIESRNVAALFVVSFAVLTAFISIWEAIRNLRRRH